MHLLLTAAENEMHMKYPKLYFFDWATVSSRKQLLVVTDKLLLLLTLHSFNAITHPKCHQNKIITLAYTIWE